MKWTTRARPHVDRCATAWLVKRFIDPQATFEFLAPGVAPSDPERAFDMPGARLSHRGEACSFEAALADHKLAGDAALARLGALVRDVDNHVMEMPESAGLDAILTGMRLAERDDARLVERAGHVFDALYAREKGREA